MTPHAQEPTPLHSNRIGLHGQRGAPGLAVLYASHTVVLDGSLCPPPIKFTLSVPQGRLASFLQNT